MMHKETQVLRCIVTAGPSWEPLDRVRRITNMSTGRLGSELAGFLAQAGHRVTLLRGQMSTWHGTVMADAVEQFSTSADLASKLRRLAAQGADAVLHAAAVSDFAVGRVWALAEQVERTQLQPGKLSTHLGTLLAELVPTAKILAQLRDWFPEARLVGWKYEVDGDRASALRAGAAQLAESRTDAAVVNGPAYGPGFGLITRSAQPVHLPDRVSLYTALGQWLTG